MSSIRIASFYSFVPFDAPESIRGSVLEAAKASRLLGRIYVASEGINGTCGGAPDDVEAFLAAIAPLLGDSELMVHRETEPSVPFRKLRVRVRPTIVNLGEEEPVNVEEEGGDRLRPAEWRKVLESDEPYVLLDVRNRIEWEVGHFTGAMPAPYDEFHQFPKWADELNVPTDVPVLMYCTGGIRCEKFSGLLKRRGYEKVYQLHGGILGYASAEGGACFEGQVTVFDDRMSVDIGGSENTWLGCIHCGTPTSRLLNCANMDCHRLHPVCDACALAHHGTCSETCKQAPRLRKFSAEHLRRGYDTKGHELPR